MKGTKKRMDAQLPPTPCTAEMRDQVVGIAQSEGKSIADIQRIAISLFLSTHAGITNKSVSVTRLEQAS